MRTRSKVAAVALVAAAGVSTGGAAIAAGSGDDADENVTGPAAEAASEAALAATGGGSIDAVERDDEANGAIWEVEVTNPDGTMVEVSVNAENRVVNTEAGDDSESESETEDGD